MSDHDKDRAIEMLLIAARYIEEYYPDGMVHYDESYCDGFCISADCLSAAEGLGWEGEE